VVQAIGDELVQFIALRHSRPAPPGALGSITQAKVVNDRAALERDDVAVVLGTETERTSCNVDELSFTRVYKKNGGKWRLLSNTQIRKEEQTQTPPLNAQKLAAPDSKNIPCGAPSLN
jgi:hypothetical protein